jgi:hypothetical protein
MANNDEAGGSNWTIRFVDMAPFDPKKMWVGIQRKKKKEEEARIEKKKREEKRKHEEEMRNAYHMRMMRQRREYERLNRESRKVTMVGCMPEESKPQDEEEKERPCKFPRWTQTTNEDKPDEDESKKTSRAPRSTQ